MKRIVIIIVCSLLVGYVGGRYGHPVKVTETKVVEVAIEKQDKSRTAKVETLRPDGTRVIREKTFKDVDTQTTKRTEAHKVVENTAGTNISVLAGVSVGQPPVWGVHMQHALIGPITAGAFVLTNGTAGVSIGLGF